MDRNAFFLAMYLYGLRASDRVFVAAFSREEKDSMRSIRSKNKKMASSHHQSPMSSSQVVSSRAFPDDGETAREINSRALSKAMPTKAS